MPVSSRYVKWLPDQPAIARLQNEPLFQNHLLPDIRSGKVFPALRKQKADFYYNGGKLFSFTGSKFKTNVKYAIANFQKEKKGEIEESSLAKIKFCPSFASGYDAIKGNCSNYAGIEAAGVFQLCRKFSLVRQDQEIVVLDTEVSYEGDEAGKHDRPDIVLYHKRLRTIRFVEAKDFSNRYSLRSKEGQPLVTEQIERYRKQVRREADILTDYTQYVIIMNHLLGTDLPCPEKVDQDVPLLVFGFDSDQKKGHFKQIEQMLKAHEITYYSKGNISSCSGRTLASWWKKSLSKRA